MKKTVTLFIFIAMIFTMTACTNRSGNQDTPVTPTVAPTATTAPTTGATTAPTQGAGTSTTAAPTESANNAATPTGTNTTPTP